MTKWLLGFLSISIAVNVYFTINYFQDPPQTSTIKSDSSYTPQVVTQVQTRFDVMNGGKPTLTITSNPIELVKTTDGRVLVSDRVTGNATVSGQSYPFDLKLNPKTIYQKRVSMWTIGYGINSRLTPNVGVIFDIPFTGSLDFMVGVAGLNLGFYWPLGDNSRVRIGVEKEWAQNGASFSVGLGTRF